MNEQIKQIAERLVGLREAMELSIDELAAICHISREEYEALESGKRDIPVSILHNISQHSHVELSTLMFGDDAHMSSYFLTRKGTGAVVERVKAYHYESLAAGFSQRKGNPFMVTVEPSEAPIHLNAHEGQEFNFVIQGRLQLQIGNNTMELNPGDSIYFDSTRPHGMKALDNNPVQFLAIIL